MIIKTALATAGPIFIIVAIAFSLVICCDKPTINRVKRKMGYETEKQW